VSGAWEVRLILDVLGEVVVDLWTFRKTVLGRCLAARDVDGYDPLAADFMLAWTWVRTSLLRVSSVQDSLHVQFLHLVAPCSEAERCVINGFSTFVRHHAP
jgi:hypothetical protein